MTERVLVMGAGSWGTALALELAGNGHEVYLTGRNPERINQLQQARENARYLPGHNFPDNLQCISDIESLKSVLNYVVFAVPCHAVRDSLQQLSRQLARVPPVCLVCKGLEPGTQLLSHEIVTDTLGSDQGVALLSGPSFAAEVARKLPTAVTIAGRDSDLVDELSNLFHNDVFRIYSQDDVTGVAIAGAIKNVLAIAAGIADGLGFGANTRAALITRGLAEIMRLGVAMGGRQETFMGLAGLGDLVLTCTDNQSRNRQLGLALAGGENLETAQARIDRAIEGARTVKEACVLAEKYQVDMPITAEVFRVLNNQCSPQEAVTSLLSRDPKPERH